MSPSLWRKIKSKARGSQQGSPRASPPPPTTPPPASLPPQTPPPLRIPAASLQARLWNRAYDELKSSESEIVEAYEKVLSAKLQDDDANPAATENYIETASEERCHQMQRLVQAGLQRTEKDAAVKQKISNVMQIASPVKALIAQAVQAAPQAAVAWVGVSFALEILANPLTQPGINRDGISYVVLRMDWYWNLVDLLLDEKSAGPASEGLRDQLEKHIIQLYQKLLLYQMKSVCLYHRSLAAVFFRDVAKMDDWAGQLDGIKAAEVAVRSDSKQFNSQQMLGRLQAMADTAERQHKELQDITYAIREQTRQQEETQQTREDKECLRDLFQTDPRHDKTRIQDTKGGLLRDSYRWILDHPDFRCWRTDTQSRLLWIRGDPGKGKTMLLCGIIDELGKDLDNKLSYFFCQATEESLRNATAVLRGLIYSLAAQYPQLISYVRKEYDSGGKQRFEGLNAWEVMSKILEAMLHDRELNGVILIIDALDECTTDRPKLLNFIARISATSGARWIISSRNWLDIEETLDCTTHKVALRLELNEESVSDAVHKYIQDKVDRLALLKKYDDATRNTVEKYLEDNSSGTFLWVALVCQQLAAYKVRKMHTLKVLKTFPPGLEHLYERMIDQISESNNADLCKEILAIVSVVYRPVTLQELMCIIQSPTCFDDDLESLEEIVGSCGSFLTLRGGTVYLVHQSAKDFLLDTANEAFKQILPFGITQQHHAIFSRSLEGLSSTLRRDIYDLHAPESDLEAISPPDPDPLAPLKYSCIHWVDHLRDSNPMESPTRGDIQDNGIVQTFLERKYLYWLEALSLLRSMSQAVLAVQTLETLVTSAGTQQLTELVRDAHRFILAYKPAVESFPLQIYMAALVFSPTRSVVRQIFQAEAPAWITVLPDIESDWGACLQTLEGHGNAVTSVAFSASSQQLASGSYDDTVKIWSAATGKCVQTLKGHTYGVASLAYSADGKHLASGSWDNTVKIWDAATGKCVQTLKGHTNDVTSLAYSVDGKHLASGSRDKTIRIWDAATGVCMQTLEGHTDMVISLAYSTDGRHLASGSADKTIRIWDAATGVCVQTLEGHTNVVESLAYSADGKQLASGSGDDTVKVWDVATSVCIPTFKGHKGGGIVRSLAFSVDGQQLVSVSADYSDYDTIKVWDVVTGACAQTFNGFGKHFSLLAFSTDGARLATGSSDNGYIWVWNLVTGICLQTLKGIRPGERSYGLDVDTKTYDILKREFGIMSDHPFFFPGRSSANASAQKPCSHGYGTSHDENWIVKDGTRLLWLPPEYRSSISAVVGSVVALGCRSGRVSWVKFLEDDQNT